jgi:cytosol alanyl aminopeptidase
MVFAMRSPLPVLFLAAACGASSSTAPVATPPPRPAPAAAVVAPPPPPPPEPPALRLPTTVHPTSNTVNLTVDPEKEDFTGVITTSLQVDSPTSVIWLNADEITIKTASLAQPPRGVQVATVLASKKGYVGLQFAQPLAPGDATLSIDYAGKAHANDGDGIYRYQENGDWYMVTQFEATDARQAFPTFDEPSFKAPWQVTLNIKSSLTALSNTPVQTDRDNGNGTRTVAFERTKPLPSYLVAFVVGPWELVDAGKTKDNVPVRIVVPRGRAADAAYPAKVSAELIDRLESYFGMPYPYPKLDLVACGVFNAGAMENAGLITFNEPIVLHKPTDMTRDREENFATVAAHEMAHQWFGDLVTMAWWDDTWLNESFASWMESKIVDAWKPEYEIGVDMVGIKSRVMGQDSLDTARSIHQPIREHGDIEASFDNITYQKGQAVLTMIERHLGADLFQRGVRDYLAKHAWGNAGYDDFVGAMSTAAGRDLHPLFDSFVKQSGIPFVSVKLSCQAGQPAKLDLAQRRYAPVGSHMDPKRTWTVPVCVKWGAGKNTGRDCTVLDQPTGELALSAKTCPAWVLPNEGELAYYRPELAGADLDHLLAHAKDLTVAERVGLLGDVEAMVNAGVASNGVALGLVADLAKDKNRHIVDASIGIVVGIDEIVPDNLRANYERMIGKLYKPRAHELGWASKPGEPSDAKQLRPTLLALVADVGKDKVLIDEATKLVWKYFDDHAAIQPELVNTALHVAARYGDQKLFDRLHTAAKAATDKGERDRLVGAMGAFQDPKVLDEARAIALTDEFDIRESLGVMFGGLADARLRANTYAWFKQHFDEVVAKMPKEYRPFIAYVAAPLCDDTVKPDVEAFLKPKMDAIDGGSHTYAQAMEQLSLCAAQKAAQLPGVVAFLKKQ